MKYINILKWNTFQHYKHRNPPWIKLHTSLLDNENFECLQDASKVLLICLWLFAARKGNGKIPADADYLQRKLALRKKPDLQPLIDTGFIEVVSDTLAECKHDASNLRQNCPSEREQSRDKDKDRVETKTKNIEVAGIEFSYETGKFTGITKKDITDWAEAYPAVNIEITIKAMAQWLISNPSKRKKKVRRFMTNWFARSQEKGGNNANGRTIKTSNKKQNPDDPFGWKT